MKKIFTSLIALFTVISSFAYDIEIDGIYYYVDLSDMTAGVTYGYNEYGYIKYTGDIVIPESVTYNSRQLEVTYIDYAAFASCSGLTSVTIPKSVTYIGYSAFMECYGLSKVYIFDLVAWCKIEFDSNPLSYAEHLYLNGEEITELTIPEEITTIGDHTFEGCSGLTRVTIPDHVTYIGDSAFAGCSGLTSVTIPDPVTYIGDWAFESCSGLTSVSIGNSVTYIGEDAFYDCSGLTSVTIPNSVISIGEDAFYDCSSLASVTIGDSVKKIREGTFSGCSALKSIVIGKSVASIEDYALEETNYEKIVFKDAESYVEISNRFNISEALKEVYLGRPGSLDILTSDCKELETVSFGRYLTALKGFSGYSKLKTINAYNPTPIKIYSSYFSNSQYMNVELNVPVGSLAAYQADPVWGQFWNIKETLNPDADGIVEIPVDNIGESDAVEVYNLQGIRMDVSSGDALQTLPRGLYIINGKKVYVK